MQTLQMQTPLMDTRLMGRSPDYAATVQRGFEAGVKMRDEIALRRALGALQGGDPNALQTIYQINPRLGMQIEDQVAQRAERARVLDSRDAMSALLLNGQGGPVNAQSPAPPPNASPSAAGQPMMQGSQMPAPHGGAPVDPLAPLPEAAGSVANQPQRPRYSPDEERLIRNDPEGFLTFQGKRIDVTKSQFESLRQLHGTAMQLLGSVHDQPTYDAAKQQAFNLYSSFGHDASEFLGGLPPQYSPETVKMLRLRGMDTSKQLAAVARENSIDSQIAVREQRADEYARHNRAMEARPTGRGRGPAPKQPSPTSVIGRIMDKQARGEPLTPAEQKTYDEYRAGRGSKASRAGGADRIGPVYQKGGKRIQYSKRAGGYVDLATGQRVN